MFAISGMPYEIICQLISDPPINRETLAIHFRLELDLGRYEANARVVESLFMQACGAPAVYDAQGRMVRAETQRNVAAAIYWTKAQMGWRETTKHEHSGPGGEPIRVESLSDAQLAALIPRVESILGGLPGQDVPDPA